MGSEVDHEVQSGDDHREAIARLFAQHQRWLFGYLVSLLGSAEDAEDVFQEVCVVIWREYEKFQLGTNFVSWVSVIAYHQVQRFWRERKKTNRMLRTSTLDFLAQEIPRDFEYQERRREALTDCLEKLKAPDRELVAHCYSDRKITMKLAAQELGRPANTVYKAMNRIRRVLFECINRRLAVEGLRR